MHINELWLRTYYNTHIFTLKKHSEWILSSSALSLEHATVMHSSPAIPDKLKAICLAEDPFNRHNTRLFTGVHTLFIMRAHHVKSLYSR